ncbi:AbrB/MazE/SpoVT family DNA-binding domain-containing protein [Nocardia sp. NPDC051990]|uniref:AbrB/MazE/SpoVT family DNA-binding domain-containing protein n=1 Tax=Nocardia sp. NPDC051990 TaxID=3155285 RepID=UPI0034243EA1
MITRPGFGRRGVTEHGHLALPAQTRRGAGIQHHDRVLLAADPDQGLLVVFPPRVLDEMAARRFREGVDR